MKRIFILKKEYIFPEWGIFKKINKIYFKRVIKFVNKLASEDKDLVIITDLPFGFKNKLFLRSFDEYINTNSNQIAFNPYGEYADANKISKKWFANNFFKENLKYKKYDIRKIIREWFTYFLITLFQEINLIEEIIKRENPDTIISLNKKSPFGKIIELICKKKRIKNYFFNFGFSNIIAFTNIIKIKFDAKVRFLKFPLISRRDFVKTSYKNNKEEIIFGAFDDYYLERFYPLIKEMKNENFLVLCRDVKTQQKLKKRRINFASFGDFLNKGDINTVKKEKKRLEKIFKYLDQFKNIFTYHKLNIYDLVKEDTKNLIINYFTYSLYYLISTENMIKKGIKNFVLLDNVLIPNNSIAICAKEKKRKSLVLQHGIFADPTKRGILPLISDKIAIWGNEVKRNFNELKEKSVVTGNVRFDKYSHQKLNNQSKSYLLLALQGFDGLSSKKEKKLLIYECISAIKKFPEKKLIIKLHPRDNEEELIRLIKENNLKNIILDFKKNTEELLLNCEALITTNSTILLDAIILNKPVIILNLINRPEILNYSKAVIRVYAKGDLSKAINQIQNKKFLKKLNKNATKFLRGYCYKIDGKASLRVIKLIKEMKENE